MVSQLSPWQYAFTFKLLRMFFLLLILSGGYLHLDAEVVSSLEREKAVAEILHTSVLRVGRFNPATIADNQIALKINQRKLRLRGPDLEKYTHLSRNKVVGIDYITAQCRSSVATLDDLMDRRRIALLYNFNNDFLQNSTIKWRRIVQTNCDFEYQTRDWFFGFVITLAGGKEHDGFSGFQKERLIYARKWEHRSGDFKSVALAYNHPRGPRPPQEFQRGSVEVIPQVKNKLRFIKHNDGYEIKFGNGPLPTPSICAGALYVSGGFGSRAYHAFDARRGTPTWSIALSDNGPSTAACTKNAVFFNTESCTLFAVKTRDGKQLWSSYLGDPLISMPTVVDGRVFASYPASYISQADASGKKGFQLPDGILAPTHVLAAFEPHTGKILWQRWIDSEIMSAATVLHDTLFITTNSGIVYGFEPATGSIKSAHRARATSPAVWHTGRLIFSRRLDASGAAIMEGFGGLVPGENQIKQLFAEFKAPYLDGKQQDKTPFARQGIHADGGNGFFGGAPSSAHPEAAYVQLGRKSVSTLQFYEGARALILKDRFVVVAGNRLVAYDDANSEEIWQIDLDMDGRGARKGGAIASAPVLAGGKVFLSLVHGQVLMIDPEDGSILRKFEIGSELRTQPLIMYGRVYIPTMDGRLVVKDLGDESISGWSTVGGSQKRDHQPSQL